MALEFNDEVTGSLEALYQTKDAATRRKAVLDALGLRVGERVLDIGTGPGFLAAQMADAVGPSGSILGIDMSQPMLKMASTRCGAKPWVKFQSGVATELPANNAPFDAAISVQVYEYVVDLDKALAEMFRVLRPGGRAVIVSTDWDAIAWNASDPRRMGRALNAFAEHCAYTALPRILAPKLGHSGFVVEDQSVIAQFNSTYGPDSYSHQISRLIAAFVPGRQGVTEMDAQDWLKDLRQTSERGEYFFSLNQYLFTVKKPT